MDYQTLEDAIARAYEVAAIVLDTDERWYKSKVPLGVVVHAAEMLRDLVDEHRRKSIIDPDLLLKIGFGWGKLEALIGVHVTYELPARAKTASPLRQGSLSKGQNTRETIAQLCADIGPFGEKESKHQRALAIIDLAKQRKVRLKVKPGYIVDLLGAENSLKSPRGKLIE